MKKLSLAALLIATVALAGVASAFEEHKAPQQQPSSSMPSTSGAGLSAPGVAMPRPDVGTKIRVPGLGVIGEIPKMDFGLELLYGASQAKQPLDEAPGNGVMGRVTVPIKPSR